MKGCVTVWREGEKQKVKSKERRSNLHFYLFGRRANILGLVTWLMEKSLDEKKHFRVLIIVISCLSGEKLGRVWVGRISLAGVQVEHCSARESWQHRVSRGDPRVSELLICWRKVD